MPIGNAILKKEILPEQGSFGMDSRYPIFVPINKLKICAEDKYEYMKICG
jgi:hypothetical protein